MDELIVKNFVMKFVVAKRKNKQFEKTLCRIIMAS